MHCQNQNTRLYRNYCRRYFDHFYEIFKMSSFRYCRIFPLKSGIVDDALIQPYSGHESRQSLEVYSKLSLGECQDEYENQIKKFPI